MFPFTAPPLARLGATGAISEETTTLSTIENIQGRTYTPDFAGPGGGAAPSLGNGTATGSFIRVGAHVSFQAKIVVGSTTSFGGNPIEIGLPAPPYSFDFLIGVRCEDQTGPANYVGFGTTIDRTSTTGKGYVTDIYVTDNATTGQIGATSPFTWATGDIIWAGGSYVALG